MFPQFGATAETLSKASTLVFRIGTDAHLYDDPEDGNIVELLESKFDSEKCEALKRLLALIAQGIDVSNFFPQVVKNVASQSLEVKKLVYLYLLHYAEKRPNEALLSINCFQKDLGDTNPLVRACALRTMAGIRLHVIAPLVLVAVGKCARDPSVYVRKCAASALPKLYDLRIEDNNSSIEEVVGILLNDNSPGVVGAAAAAFASVCPDNFSLIGKSYRRLCEILPDVEEWGQIVLIGILLRYVIAKHGLAKESVMSFLHHTETPHVGEDDPTTNFMKEETIGMMDTANSELTHMICRSYIEGPDEYLSRSSYINKGSNTLDSARYTSSKSNDDVKLLLQGTSPLLWSYNSAVVIAAAGVHWIMAPVENVKRIVKPLLFVLRSSHATRYVVLYNIQVFAKAMPSLFAPYYEDFFISSSDTYQIRSLKLDILSSIAMDSSVSAILREFQDYIRDPDRRFAADTVSAIGLCAQRLPAMAETCLDGLLALSRQEIFSSEFGSVDEESRVLTQIIMSIKSIVKHNPLRHEKVIIQLFRKLDSIKVPAARAMVIWMLGEYNTLGGIIPKMLTTILKYLAWCFKSEALEAKLQILPAIVKVLYNAKGDDHLTVRKVVNYVFDLAECDISYDVRDRARLLKKTLEYNSGPRILETENSIPAEKDLQHAVLEHLFGGNLKPVSPEPPNSRFYLPGSLSQIVLHAAPGYEPLPKPCSLLQDDLDQISNDIRGMDLNEMNDSNTSSGSLDEETASDYSSQNSISGSSNNSDSYENGSVSEDNGNNEPLIEISEVGIAPRNENVDPQSSLAVGELMSKTALESWLDEHPGLANKDQSDSNRVRRTSARISIGDIASRVKPKVYTLLDPANGNGLKVDYSFSSEVSSISPLLVCVEVLFKNCSAEVVPEITLVDEDSNSQRDSADQLVVGSESTVPSLSEVPHLVPLEEVTSLEPGQAIKRTIQVRFHHHLLPLKLALLSNGKRIPVKLRPDIGYFVKPLHMSIEVFLDKESHLPGMFEYIRRCNFCDHLVELNKDKSQGAIEKDKFLVICESIALKMLSNANLFLVSTDMPVDSKLDDAKGLCLRFSCKILSSSVPCLISVTVEEGKCSEPLNLSVKVNCEETVFGLNLLNRVVNFLAEAP
ncbi:AP3-complex subunit beta-A isoform X1 [Punica granatum]|uniref:AP-3 complex subunit beta n=3 Tax=Punica granatum TaxID=22663 RepID=A0A6P8BNZ0_PUNGR|nr:AP3-complex subunit beta-A isoform X1 [Punica granatum]